MKGTLTKTEQGWVVTYGTSFLPLHPKNVYSVVNGMNGMGVEFEIVTETYDDGKGCTYAKIINNDVDRISDEEQEWMDAPMGHIQSVEDDVEKLAAIKFLENQYNENGKLTAVDFYQAKQMELKAKETLYTEEQMMEALKLSKKIRDDESSDLFYTDYEIIQSLKQLKK